MKITYISPKFVLAAAVLMLSLQSCKKDMIAVNQGEGTVKESTNSGITEDDKLHQVKVEIPAQTVKTSVNGTLLTMLYTEDISALLDPKGYDQSFSIRLHEDFSASTLGNFSFTVPAPNGASTTDWAGNNLKILDEVTKSDLVVDGKPMVKLHLVRYFTFTKNYATPQQATDQQTVLLNTKTDKIKFYSYVAFVKDYPTTSVSAPLVYIK